MLFLVDMVSMILFVELQIYVVIYLVVKVCCDDVGCMLVFGEDSVVVELVMYFEIDCLVDG